MNVYCIVMFKFNYSVGDIKNDLGEGIVCLGEGSGGKGGAKWGKGGGKWGKRGREVGNAYPPVHPLCQRLHDPLTESLYITEIINSQQSHLWKCVGNPNVHISHMLEGI